jgi:hypothetical protein
MVDPAKNMAHPEPCVLCGTVIDTAVPCHNCVVNTLFANAIGKEVFHGGLFVEGHTGIVHMGGRLLEKAVYPQRDRGRLFLRLRRFAAATVERCAGPQIARIGGQGIKRCYLQARLIVTSHSHVGLQVFYQQLFETFALVCRQSRHFAGFQCEQQLHMVAIDLPR